MVLSTYCPWKSHLLELEEEMGIAGQLKFVLYAEGEPAGKWRIQVGAERFEIHTKRVDSWVLCCAQCRGVLAVR